MPVMKAKCSTCPFGEDGDRVLEARVTSRLLGASQICHHPRLSNHRETHLCRGARDWQLTIFYRLGQLSEPTDAAWAAKLGERGREADYVSFTAPTLQAAVCEAWVLAVEGGAK